MGAKVSSKNMKKFFWSLFEFIETVVVAVVAVFFVRAFIAQPFLVNGASMERTFYDGDYLLIDELTYRFREPQRGEVIVFKYPNDTNSYYIKRVIGLPNEIVAISNGIVSVISSNGEKTLDEEYLEELRGRGDMKVTLGPQEYFVMGDNRNFSFDSRNWGPLRRSYITGLVRVRLWPIDQVQAFTAPVY